MSHGEAIKTPEQRLEYLTYSIGRWLRTYASLQLKDLRKDEAKHGSEIRKLTRLLQLTAQFQRVEEDLPDLSHLLSGSMLKKYEIRRKQYVDLYRKVKQ